MVKFSVLGVMMPWGDELSVALSAFEELPMTRASTILVYPSIMSLETETSIPATLLSAVLKSINSTAPTRSAMAPFLPFFHEVAR